MSETYLNVNLAVSLSRFGPKITKDPDVAAFIQQESLTPEELNRSISKFNQYITEREKFLRGDTDYIAKGYKPILVMNHGYADVSYEETPELIS